MDNKQAPQILSCYILACLDFFEHQGADRNTIGERAGVDLTQCSMENPRSFTVDELIRIYRACQYEIPIKNGLALGDSFPMTIHGMAGISAMSQPTYSACLMSATRFCDKAFPAISMEYFETQQYAGIRIHENLGLGVYLHYLLEALYVNFHNIFHFLMGKKEKLAYLAFPYPEPEYRNEFDRYFSCELRFNATHAEFVVPKHLAQRELKLSDQFIAKTAEQDFLKTVPSINFNSLPKRLHQVLSERMGYFPSLEEAALRLGMSGRTLRRQLNQLGTNFQNELDTIRKEQAIEYLLNSNKCITDIALMLGFCDSSAFSKAFKKWTAQSPREFKKSYDQSTVSDQRSSGDRLMSATR